MTGKDKVKDIEFKDYLKKLKGLLKPGDMGDERDSGSGEELDPDRIYSALLRVTKERELFLTALDNAVDSFHLADGKGNILFVNKTFADRSQMAREDVIGKNVADMPYKPSGVLLAIKEKRRLSFMQHGIGGDAIATTVPVLDEDGEVRLCVSNARFINELELLSRYYTTQRGKGGAAPAPGISTTPELSSSDESMQKLYDFAKQIAAADSGVLITGETGTGKSVLAKYIHENSPRSKKKFVELNCAAIPESLIESELFGYETGAFTGAQKGGKPGLFEAADGGTLFLDEIGDMPLQLQPKLLHALQNKTITRVGGTRQIPVNVRIITATNKNLENLVKEGLFRNDLYYRINIVPISIPPLRERKSDITPLINSFVDRFNKHYNQSAAIDDGAMKLLNLYKWPGNIRELENMIERLLVTNKSGIITEWDLPNNIRIMTDSDDDSGIHVSKLMPLKDALEAVEGELVRMAFKDGASTYDVARKLKISQSGASRKYLKYVKNAPLSD